MKKTIFAFILMAGFSFAANAQATEKSTDSTIEPAKVEVAGQVATETTVAEPVTSKTTESATPAKSCCSSKKGKETASTKSKSCCADGKKSKAECADKKEETTITQ